MVPRKKEDETMVMGSASRLVRLPRATVDADGLTTAIDRAIDGPWSSVVSGTAVPGNRFGAI